MFLRKWLSAQSFRFLCGRRRGKVEVAGPQWGQTLLHLYDVVVLLAFLGENILAVEDGFCADLGVDIRDFLFVDAHSVALNHLAAFAL